MQLLQRFSKRSGTGEEIQNELKCWLTERNEQAPGTDWQSRVLSLFKLAILMAVLCLSPGCLFIRTRMTEAYDVKDTGEKIMTRNKYYLVGIVSGNIERKGRNVSSYFSNWLAGQKIPVFEKGEGEQRGTSIYYNHITFKDEHNDFKQHQPGVFAEEGIPIIVRQRQLKDHNDMSILHLYLTVLGGGMLFPWIQRAEQRDSFEIICLGEITPSKSNKIERVRKTDTAGCNMPWSLLFFTSLDTIKGFEDKRIFRYAKTIRFLISPYLDIICRFPTLSPPSSRRWKMPV
ncbi:MAG: hypothetical protein IJJ33_17235 [Victivallales bacterium]|nr:hypothetical protein [Victivallales bacterium]MBQ6473733.1 hypothetical protein [Victivallales bacterium]